MQRIQTLSLCQDAGHVIPLLPENGFLQWNNTWATGGNLKRQTGTHCIAFYPTNGSGGWFKERSILTNSFCFKNKCLCVSILAIIISPWKQCFLENPILVNYWKCCSSFSIQFLVLLYEYSPSSESSYRCLYKKHLGSSIWEARQFLSWFVFACLYLLSF